jgi:ankyrin repeat protein
MSWSDDRSRSEIDPISHRPGPNALTTGQGCRSFCDDQTRWPSFWTPLAIAAQHGHPATVSALADVGADPNVVTQDGWTPLAIVAQHGHAAALSALVNAGADPNKPIPSGRTPLIISAEKGLAGVLSTLVHAGADPNETDGSGCTPLGRPSAGERRCCDSRMSSSSYCLCFFEP